MWKELKRNMKLLRYGFQYKTNVAVGLMFFVLGMVLLCVNSMETMGALYVFLGSCFMTQVLMCLPMADSIAASPRKRGIEIKTASVMMVVGTVVSFGIILAAFWIKYLKYPTEERFAITLIGIAIMICFLQLYFVLAYKSMILTTIVMIVFFVLMMPKTMTADFTWNILFGLIGELTMLKATIVSSGIVLVGVALGHLLHLVCYRLAPDKWSAGVALRKYL